MGGFSEGSEGVAGGVPFACYPSGCDQFYNTQRAIQAGIGIRIPFGLNGIGDLVIQALKDEEMLTRAQEAAWDLQEFHGNQRALEAIEQCETDMDCEFETITDQDSDSETSTVMTSV